jgi:serine protease Do
MTRNMASRILTGSVLTLSLAAAQWTMAMPHPLTGEAQNSAYLGVSVDNVSPETASLLHLANGGTVISTVDQDGPACQAGLKTGDIVTAFNGKPVGGPDQLAAMIHGTAPGTTVTLKIVRNGHNQDMKVKLGAWPQFAGVPMPPHAPLNPVGTLAMPPMPPMTPDVEFHSFTPLLARSGIVVEPLCPQLSEFFGVTGNKGVLVRTVEKGSPGAAAGLKAGDVIVRVNNETIHDMQDWKRALKAQGKLTLSVVRDKHEQTLQMNLPASTSEFRSPDWESFGRNMQEFSAEMQQLQPELAANAQEWAQLDQVQMEALQRQIRESMKAIEPEMKRHAEEISKQTAQMKVQSEELQKEIEKMTPELQRQAKEMAGSMKPSAKDLADMNREIQLQMKNLQPDIQKQMEEFRKQWQEQQPQFKKQMEEFRKQWQQEMQEWQKSFQSSSPKQM